MKTTSIDTPDDAVRETDRAIDEVCASIGKDLADYTKQQLLKLTSAELNRLRTQPGHYRAARVLILAVAAERIASQWGAESYKQDLRRVKKIMKNRY